MYKHTPDSLLSALQKYRGNTMQQQAILANASIEVVIDALSKKVRAMKDEEIKARGEAIESFHNPYYAVNATPEAFYRRVYHKLHAKATPDNLKAFNITLKKIKARESLTEEDCQAFRYIELSLPPESTTTHLLLGHVRAQMCFESKVASPILKDPKDNCPGFFKFHLKNALRDIFINKIDPFTHYVLNTKEIERYGLIFCGIDEHLIRAIFTESPDILPAIKRHCLGKVFDNLLKEAKAQAEHLNQKDCGCFYKRKNPKAERIEAVIRCAQVGKDRFIDDYLRQNGLDPNINAFQMALMQHNGWSVVFRENSKEEKSTASDSLKLALQERQHFKFRKDDNLDAKRVYSANQVYEYIDRGYRPYHFPAWFFSVSTPGVISVESTSASAPVTASTPLLSVVSGR